MAVRPVEEQDCEEESMEAEYELGARKNEMMRSPSLPNTAEVEEHEKTHRSGVGAATASEEKERKPSSDE